MPETRATNPILPPGPKQDGRVRAVIDAVLPWVDGGRFAVKHIAGESMRVTAYCFADGHDVLRVMLRWREENQAEMHETPMKP